MLSDDMKPSAQCIQAYKRASSTLVIYINRTISYRNPELLVKLYKSLVRPHVEHCTVAWSPYYVKDKTLLEKIQNRFTQMVPDLKNEDYYVRNKRMGLWTPEERRNRADLIQVFKMLKGLSLPSF